MSTRRLLLTLLTVAVLLPVAPPALEGQLRRIGQRVRSAVEDETGRALEREAREAVRCSLDDEACVSSAQAEGKSTVYVDSDGNVITDAEGAPITNPDDARAATEGPGSEIWTNYDFVPGSEVLFALDLESERVGRFPARQLEFVSGNAEIVERGGERMIQFTAATTFRLNFDEALPDHFTMELMYQAGVRNAWVTIANGPMPENMGGYEYDYLSLMGQSGIYRQRQPLSVSDSEHIDDELASFKLQVDRDPEIEKNPDYAILYAGPRRIAQVPNANFERSQVIEFHVVANESRPAFLSELVVAAHGDPLYESLTTGENMFTTRGILFDFDSDRIRGESTPTLDEIVRTLERHDDLEIEVQGHTDAVGEDEYNQSLSERRAQAVVDHLAGRGIDRSRLTAVGRGESEPVADNETESGRQQNRRVVLKNVAAR